MVAEFKPVSTASRAFALAMLLLYMCAPAFAACFRDKDAFGMIGIVMVIWLSLVVFVNPRALEIPAQVQA